MHSIKIKLNSLKNTRDLGGIINKDGYKIKPKKLLRSSALAKANKEDLQKLYEEYNVRTIIDFRSSLEIKENPDKAFNDQIIYINSIMEERAAGITHDKKSEKELKVWEKKNMSALDAKEGMKKLYAQMAGQFSTEKYRNFMKYILDNQEAILWHCAVGKDRCGMGTALVLSALDVDKKIIIEDYLYSNDCLHADEPFNECAKCYTDWVHIDYITEYFKIIDQLYGSMDNYLNKYLNITEREKKILKDKYLQKD